MDTKRFDTLVRLLSRAGTRRGALALLAGLAGLPLAEAAAQPRKRIKRRRPKRRQRTAGRASRDRASAPQRRATAAPALTIEVGCPEHPADEILLLGAVRPHQRYWWDHRHLTVAVQAHPNADPKLISAARQAIGLWDDVLQADPVLGPADIRLIDVTDTLKPAHRADIVLHYVPKAGGVVFSGYAICGAGSCNNVIIRSDLPARLGGGQYSPFPVGYITMHELGHAIGLGHAEPILETNDLMGYNWPPLFPKVTPCDLKGLREVWAWAINGTEPAPPTTVIVNCRGLCP
jgi:hypothetical protein